MPSSKIPTANNPPNGNRKPSSESNRQRPVFRNYMVVARGAGLVVIRVIGTGNMITAPALNEFIEHQRSQGFHRFVFDLALCRGFDSTFMGCMVGASTALRKDARRAEGSGDSRAAVKDSAEPGEGEGEGEGCESLSPEEALQELQRHLARKRKPSAPAAPEESPGDGFVVAVNVSPECKEMMNILGVDRFVRLLGIQDLGEMEMMELPEKPLPPDERRRLILMAHENLVEIDKRNEVQFGAFLRSLSDELAKEKEGGSGHG